MAKFKDDGLIFTFILMNLLAIMASLKVSLPLANITIIPRKMMKRMLPTLLEKPKNIHSLLRLQGTSDLGLTELIAESAEKWTFEMLQSILKIVQQHPHLHQILLNNNVLWSINRKPSVEFIHNEWLNGRIKLLPDLIQGNQEADYLFNALPQIEEIDKTGTYRLSASWYSDNYSIQIILRREESNWSGMLHRYFLATDLDNLNGENTRLLLTLIQKNSSQMTFIELAAYWVYLKVYQKKISKRPFKCLEELVNLLYRLISNLKGSILKQIADKTPQIPEFLRFLVFSSATSTDSISLRYKTNSPNWPDIDEMCLSYDGYDLVLFLEALAKSSSKGLSSKIDLRKSRQRLLQLQIPQNYRFILKCLERHQRIEYFHRWERILPPTYQSPGRGYSLSLLEGIDLLRNNFHALPPTVQGRPTREFLRLAKVWFIRQVGELIEPSTNVAHDIHCIRLPSSTLLGELQQEDKYILMTYFYVEALLQIYFDSKRQFYDELAAGILDFLRENRDLQFDDLKCLVEILHPHLIRN